MLLRHRRPEDLDRCVAVLAAVHLADGYPMSWPADPARWLQPAGELAAWVAEDAGGLAGHVCLCGTEADEWSACPGLDGRRPGAVKRLYVSPAARGRGLGTALLAAACAGARGRELHPVLDVLARDGSAVAFYERLGWRLCGPADSLRRYVAPDAAVSSRA